MWLKNNLTKEEEIQGRLRGLARGERERKQGKGRIYKDLPQMTKSTNKMKKTRSWKREEGRSHERR